MLELVGHEHDSRNALALCPLESLPDIATNAWVEGVLAFLFAIHGCMPGKCDECLDVVALLGTIFVECRFVLHCIRTGRACHESFLPSSQQLSIDFGTEVLHNGGDADVADECPVVLALSVQGTLCLGGLIHGVFLDGLGGVVLGADRVDVVEHIDDKPFFDCLLHGVDGMWDVVASSVFVPEQLQGSLLRRCGEGEPVDAVGVVHLVNLGNLLVYPLDSEQGIRDVALVLALGSIVCLIDENRISNSSAGVVQGDVVSFVSLQELL